VHEQLAELIVLAEKIASQPQAPVQLAKGYDNLTELL
jgi:hypothetical protein